MKGATFAVMIISAGGLRHAQSIDLAAERTVTVCMEGGVGSPTSEQAQKIASGIFTGIGVILQWRRGLQDCPSKGIRVSLSDHTPASLKPGAMAYALPYEGAHIRVFYDRVSRAATRSLVPRLLAHVLVHEITHILQGVDRHSDSGIMKDHWDSSDFHSMAWKPLYFEPRDVDLIYRGLAGRAGRAILENPPAPIATK